MEEMAMAIRSFSALLVAILVLAASSPSHAGVYLRPHVGYLYYSIDEPAGIELDGISAVTMGATVGGSFLPFISVEGEFGYTSGGDFTVKDPSLLIPQNLRPEFEQDAPKLWHVNGNARLSVGLTRFTPFVVVGVGIIHASDVDEDGQVPIDGSTDLAVNVGGGADFPVVPLVKLFAEYRVFNIDSEGEPDRISRIVGGLRVGF
jgi:opacity protein-like surface antigen